MYNLWNLALTEEGCEFDVTPANVFSVGRGSVEWIQACVAAWALSGADRVEGWTTRPVRSSYFSDYLTSDDWRDRWGRGWVVRVRGRFTYSAGAPLCEMKYLHEPDPTSRDDEEGAESADGCSALIIAGVRGERPEVEAGVLPSALALAARSGFADERLQVALREIQGARPPLDDETCTLWRSLGSAGERAIETWERKSRPLVQIRLVVDGTKFPDDEPKLSELVKALEQMGLFVHRHALEYEALSR